MALIKDNRITKDIWQTLGAGGPLPQGPVLAPLSLWLERKAELRAHPFARGVILPNDADVESLVDDLGTLDLVVLEFPAFTDGRAYTQSGQLREHYHYGGEIRATGEVLRDQVSFMLRCGINAFEIKDQASLAPWQSEQNRFTHWYQPAADRQAAIFDLRHQAVAAE